MMTLQKSKTHVAHAVQPKPITQKPITQKLKNQKHISYANSQKTIKKFSRSNFLWLMPNRHRMVFYHTTLLPRLLQCNCGLDF